MKATHYKNNLILFTTATLFSVVYYYIYATLFGMSHDICGINVIATLGLCIFGAIYLLLFGFAFYRIWAYQTTILPQLPVSGLMKPEEESSSFQSICNSGEQADDIAEKFRFTDKMPHYKADLERWMREQKPYLNKDFKMLDVMRVLPLNRSYISRLFNEGYGTCFFDFVMHYRLDESVRMLKEHPEMNIRHISDACGFSSPSVFGRAFLKHMGVTPKLYRTNLSN